MRYEKNKRYPEKRYLEKRYSYYNDSSVAHELEPEYYPEQERQKRKRSKPRKKFSEEIRSLLIQRTKLIASIFIVFTGAIITMGSHAIVDSSRRERNKLQDELMQLQADNVAKEAEIVGSMDLEKVKEDAVSRLGMAPPQDYQVIFIDVPKSSYTITYDLATEDEENKIKAEIILNNLGVQKRD